MATSAHFGTILSMAGVSLLLSFLPLLPKHILLAWVESLPSLSLRLLFVKRWFYHRATV